WKEPSGVRSAALKSETLFPLWLAIITFSPSKAAAVGWAPASPLPVRVASTVPVEARTTETVPEDWLGTQTLVPSKTGKTGCTPTVTVWRIVAKASSFRSDPAEKSVIQTFAPSNTAPSGAEKPTVTVVTVHGSDTVGVTIETEPGTSFAVQIRPPS